MKKKSQINQIRDHLNEGRSLTALDALDLYGCMRLAAIIHTLHHDEGMEINRETIKTNSGKSITRYTAKNPDNKDQYSLFNNNPKSPKSWELDY